MSSDEVETDSDASSNLSVASSHGDPPISTVQLTPGELQTVLKDTQLKYQKLEQKFKTLHTKYNSLKSSKSANVKKACTVLVGNEREIKHAGARFSFAYELWVDESIFHIDHPEGVDPLNVKRYNTALTQKVAIAAELYKSLPPHLQEELADPRRRKSFMKLFLEQLRQERANTISTTRRVVGEILEVDTAHFRSKVDHSKIKKLQDLLVDTQNPNLENKYPALAAVLFPSRDCSSTSPFAVEELPLFLKTILFGVSSLGGDPTGNRTPKSILWGLKKTTLGMIALAATVICQFPHLRAQLSDVKQIMFVCGPDKTFSERTKGPTNIEWGDRFLTYKQMVLSFPPNYYTFLLSWYDERVFLTSSTSESRNLSSTPQQGLKALNPVDDLIQRMSNTTVVPTRSLSASVTPHHQESTPSFYSAPGSPVSAPATTVDRDLTNQAQATPVPEQEHVAPRNRRAKEARDNAQAQTGSTQKTRSGVAKARG
ncbi:hypothetical protein EDB83DRAFT_2521326 [Lactarius deliciosus]|nr:hypothetical protein EDB83DRAFT_2521326 [Lactarius deliciosus]